MVTHRTLKKLHTLKKWTFFEHNLYVSSLKPELLSFYSSDTYVMKLFDRSVDLAQFDEETSLYPVCRAWLKNQPSNRTFGARERSPSPEPVPEIVEPTEESEVCFCCHGYCRTGFIPSCFNFAQFAQLTVGEFKTRANKYSL